LFRSAASDRAARTVGVLMTGMMDDGVAGLRDIHRAGGMTIVQLPADAPFPELPQRALQAFEPHRVLRTDEIGLAIAELAGTDSRRSSPTIVM
jgi:two-component system chemotaxis response regulator CheB